MIALGTIIRRASEADYRAFYHHDPSDGWAGFVAERADEVVAAGGVWIDTQGRAWVAVDKIGEVPPLMLHHLIADFLAALQQEGIAALYALCDERIPSAARWLARMGFAIDETIPKVYTPQVDKFLPVWKRLLNGMES